MSPEQTLLDELEALSQIMSDMSEQRGDVFFLGVSHKIDELMIDYNDKVRKQNSINKRKGIKDL